jgi:hypothetical protein
MAGFPAARYAKGKAAVVVNDPGAEKALGKGWFEHPLDAEAGRKLTPAERGGERSTFNPLGHTSTAEEVAAQESRNRSDAKARADAEARDRADARVIATGDDRAEAAEEARAADARTKRGQL